ncbi:MAG: hypothetical protein QXK06_05435, partial [Candidatus Diapherotrites archaeon]
SFETVEKKTEIDDLRVELILVNPPSGEQSEGQAFSFTAVTNHPFPEELEFEWSFGDGVIEKGTGLRRSFHAFYGLGSDKERVFLVRVTARDSKGSAASAEVSVRVLKSFFKGVVLEPKATAIHSKKGDLNVVVKFLDGEDQLVDCKNIEINAFLAGKKVNLACSGGLFKGSLSLWLGLTEMELLELSAELRNGGQRLSFKTRVPVYFESMQVIATNAFQGKKYFLNDKLEKARVGFSIEGIGLVSPKKIQAFLLTGKNPKELQLQVKGLDCEVSFDHRVSEQDLSEGLALKLSGIDAYGNKISSLQQVPISDDNPELSVFVLEPLPEEMVFAFSQQVFLRAKILSTNPYIESPRIEIECREIGFSRELSYDIRTGEFSTVIRLPDANFGSSKIKCRLFGFGFVEGRTVADLEYLDISLSRDLKLEFVFPKAGSNRIWENNASELKVRVFQPNNRLFTGTGLQGVLWIDGNNQSVFLHFDERERLHRALLAEPVPLGEHSLELLLSGDFKANSRIPVVIEKDYFLASAFFYILTSISLVIFLFFLYVLARNIVLERRFLLMERERLKLLQQKYKVEFFKQRISEKEFSEKTRLFSAGIKKTSLLLRNGSWLYCGFLKTFFRSKDFKRLPEKLQVLLLESRLSARHCEYSRAEIRKFLTEEKFDSNIIEKVLARLYG